jgi:hypothetical protein
MLQLNSIIQCSHVIAVMSMWTANMWNKAPNKLNRVWNLCITSYTRSNMRHSPSSHYNLEKLSLLQYNRVAADCTLQQKGTLERGDSDYNNGYLVTCCYSAGMMPSLSVPHNWGTLGTKPDCHLGPAHARCWVRHDLRVPTRCRFHQSVRSRVHHMPDQCLGPSLVSVWVWPHRIAGAHTP